jgi:hypothetical protein
VILTAKVSSSLFRIRSSISLGPWVTRRTMTTTMTTLVTNVRTSHFLSANSRFQTQVRTPPRNSWISLTRHKSSCCYISLVLPSKIHSFRWFDDVTI